MKKLKEGYREFTATDRSYYPGAENFPDGTPPLLGEIESSDDENWQAILGAGRVEVFDDEGNSFSKSVDLPDRSSATRFFSNLYGEEEHLLQNGFVRDDSPKSVAGSSGKNSGESSLEKDIGDQLPEDYDALVTEGGILVSFPSFMNPRKAGGYLESLELPFLNEVEYDSVKFSVSGKKYLFYRQIV